MLTSAHLITGRITGLRGWRRHAAAFLAGLVSVLAMAPFFITPILFATFPVLIWLIDGALGLEPILAPDDPKLKWWRRRPMRAALIGWWFAFGYFAGGLFWIGEAFLVEAETFAWLLPFAVTLMPAGLALFWAAAVGIAALAWRPGFIRILALAVSLSAFEWLRGHVFTGFPWNVPGYALSYPLVFMQSAGVVGIYGLTLIAMIVFTAPAVIWLDFPYRGTEVKRRNRRAALIGVAVAAIPLVVMALYGWYRLSLPSPAPYEDIKVRIVQPSIVQSEKWKPEHQARIFNLNLSLSRQNADGKRDDLRGTTLLIWPEAAMPFLPLREPKALRAIAELLPEGTFLISGALRMRDPIPGLPRSRRQIFNSALVFGSQGNLLAQYDKTHLVPFGEYLPFQKTLEALGLEQLTRLRGGFNIGASPRPLLAIPGLPKIGALICYEVIFPGVGAQAAARPEVLVNLTNDGWFGNTTGPRQHMFQARVRAVEEGLPLIRAANNGISVVIDPYGRILHALDMNEVGVIDSILPGKISAPLYSRLGDMVFAIMWLICLTLLFLGLYRFGLLKTSSLRT